jgi:pantetheine-phosphate adenylyltransferase
MSNIIYPGSFDPFTNGHLHVVKHASKLFDHVFLVIATNEEKERRMSRINMRIAIENDLCDHNISNVTIIEYDGLISDFAKKHNIKYLFKGLRNESDFQYEKNMEKVNRQIFDLETVYIGAGDTEHISSSMVMLLHSYGVDVSNLVPKNVYKLMKGGE